MGIRKGSKKKGSRKRKANTWDDAAAPVSKAMTSPQKTSVRFRPNGSMMSQWKTQKVATRVQSRTFVTNVAMKKKRQYEVYNATREHTVNGMYTSSCDVQDPEPMQCKHSSDESESDDEDARKSQKSVFQAFIDTFKKPSECIDYTDDEEANDKSIPAYTDVEKQEKDANPPNEEQLAEMAKDDEVAINDIQEEEEEEDMDPFRRRYLLSSFTEEEAKTFESATRKFVKIHVPMLDEGKYEVGYKSGASMCAGVASAITTPDVATTKKLYVRARLLSTWKERKVDVETMFSKGSVPRMLFQQMATYTDVFFAGQTYENTPVLRQLSAMHVLNHVFKTRDTILRNNERLRKQQERNNSIDTLTEGEREYRDQGFCRATVLVLLPLRSAAMAFVQQLLALLPATIDTFHNQNRFWHEFGGTTASPPLQDEEKPEWQRVFAQGNNDDCFQVGLAFSRKAVRFYSEYHHADVILASPLGLRQQLGDDVTKFDHTDTNTDVKLTTDVLSSIEVCVIDSGSLICMQNIDHLRLVLQAINQPCKEAPFADFARLHEWHLTFLASFFRQTIVFAHNIEPVLHAVISKTCKNLSGVVKIAPRYDMRNGSAAIARVVPRVKQLFQRVDMDHLGHLSPNDDVECRFAYFQKHVFARLLDHPRKHVLVFIPSYFDYVRLRNLFHDSMHEKLLRSVQCCEYTTNTQVSRARTTFFHGHCHVMLYTERFHFYHQYQIRGVHQIIWYGLPVMAEFYPEMLNLLPMQDERDNNGLVDSMDTNASIALFSRLDQLRLQRIVGNKRAERMCHAKALKSTFLFC